MRTSSTDDLGSMTLHLLDSAQGHRIQSWRFQDRSQVTIGRDDDSDIALADTQVSRKHVEIVYREGKWMLHSHGRNGTWIGGAMVSEANLTSGAIFQLGSGGPSFQFVTVNDSLTPLATIDAIAPDALDFLAIDEERKAEEVRQIADGDAFRELLEQARRLKSGDGGRDAGS